MKALITGISGFVGAALARHLVAQGWEVNGIARQNSNLWRLDGTNKEIFLYRGDLLDAAFVNNAILKSRPDVIFHLGVYGAYPKQNDPELILKTSVISTQTLLSASKEAGVRMFINTGSSSEYGTKDHPMREDEFITPNSYYAVGKSAQTHLCQHVARTEKLPVITLRLFSVYGQFEEPGRFIPTVISSALQNKEIFLADSRIGRDFIYVTDVVSAYVLAAGKPELSGEVFNIGTGIQSTLGEAASLVKKISRSSSAISEGGYEKRSFDTYAWLADTHKMKSVLGFEPKYTLETGLEDCIPWFQTNIHHYNAEQK